MPICPTRPIIHDGYRLHTAPPPLCRQTSHRRGLSLRTFNTHDGRGFMLVQAIRAVQISGFGLMIMIETKIANQYYCHNRLGYDVVCSLSITTAADGAQGGVGLVVWDQPQGWSIESTRFRGPKLVICKVVTGIKRTPHCRIPPSLHPGALTVIWGVPDRFTGAKSHIDRGPQCQYRPSPEPLQSAGCWSDDGVRAGGPHPPLSAALEVPTHEDVFSCETRHIDAGKMWLHLGEISELLWNGGNKGRK